jgi:hypothetical protein
MSKTQKSFDARKEVHDSCFALGKAGVSADAAFLVAFVQALESPEKSVLKEAIEGYYRSVVLKSKEAESVATYVRMSASYFNILGVTENADGTATYFNVDASGKPVTKPDDDANMATRNRWDIAKSAEQAHDARFRRIVLVAHRGVHEKLMTIEESGEIAVKNAMFMSSKDAKDKPKKADSWTDVNSAQGRSIKKLADSAKEFYAVKAKPRTRGSKGADIRGAAKEVGQVFSHPENVIKSYVPDTEAELLKACIGLMVHFNVLGIDKDGVVTESAGVPTKLYQQYVQLTNGVPAKEIWEDTEEEDDGEAEEQAA